MEINALKAQCTQVRRDIIAMLAKSGSGHPGGSLSAVEILVALYGDVMNVNPKEPHMAHRAQQGPCRARALQRAGGERLLPPGGA